MLDYLITSKTRLKLVLKFFLNTETKGYLRGLAKEFDESTNSVRVELNRFVEAGLLDSEMDGRKKVYMANKKHNLFADIHNIVTKFVGIDQLVEQIVTKLGDVKAAYIIGDYASGIDSGVIQLVIVGDVDGEYLETLVSKTERLIDRRISVDVKEVNDGSDIEEGALVVWGAI